MPKFKETKKSLDEFAENAKDLSLLAFYGDFYAPNDSIAHTIPRNQRFRLFSYKGKFLALQISKYLIKNTEKFDINKEFLKSCPKL